MSATATLDRLTHTYSAVNGERVSLCVSDVLRLSGIVQPYPDSAKQFVEHARDLGETVHEWAEFLDSSPNPLAYQYDCLEESEPLPYVMAYQRFREEHEPLWEHIETSFADTALDCAGTPDRIGTIAKGKKRIPVIIDIKTPKQAQEHWQLQLSAYQYLSRRLDCGLYVLHLAKDASFKLRPYESDTETFLSAVRVAQWRLKNGVKVK